MHVSSYNVLTAIYYAVIFSWMVDDGGISAQILAKVLGHLLQNYSEVQIH